MGAEMTAKPKPENPTSVQSQNAPRVRRWRRGLGLDGTVGRGALVVIEDMEEAASIFLHPNQVEPSSTGFRPRKSVGDRRSILSIESETTQQGRGTKFPRGTLGRGTSD
jgi:hypothetical protein